MGENNMSINLINYALAKKDWEKAYEDLKVLEIGGRNYHVNTTNEFRKAVWSSWNFYPNGHNYQIPVTPREYYTARVYYKDVSTSDGVSVGLRIIWKLEDGSIQESTNSETSIAPGEEGYVTITRKAPDNAVSATVVLRKFSGGGNTGEAEYKELKFEKDNKATDWTPAPEDINAHPFVAELAETVYRSKQNEERIQNLENAITSLGGGS